jgi:hypothetical protein
MSSTMARLPNTLVHVMSLPSAAIILRAHRQAVSRSHTSATLYSSRTPFGAASRADFCWLGAARCLQPDDQKHVCCLTCSCAHLKRAMPIWCRSSR